MFETLAVMLVGMGLMFYGMKVLSAETKQLTGRRLRIRLEKLTSNRIVGIFTGFLLGSATHSGSSAALITTNLVLSRLISLRNALPILAAANVGTVVIVFLISINIKLGIMYLLGISAMLYSLSKNAAKMTLVRVCFGIGVLLFGFHELELGAEKIIENESIHMWLGSIQNFFILGVILLLIGAGLRLLTQSSSTVAILVIFLGHAGILNENQMMLMVIGAPLAAGILLIVESHHEKGSLKQIPVFQIYFELSGALIYGALLLIEVITGVPLVKSLITGAFSHATQYVAVTLLTIRLIPFIFALLFNKKISEYLERKYPPIKEETLASPKYIFDQAIENPETAIELVEKEVFRILNRFPAYLENIRVEHDNPELIDNEILHDATRKLGKEIELFMKDMFNSNLSHETSERLLKIQSWHSINMMMEENIHSLVKEVIENPVPEELNKLRINIIESLHAVLVICKDSVVGEGFTVEQLVQMTSDKGSIMERLRNKYLSEFEDPDGNTRKTMMYATDLYQRIIWLVNKWAMSV